MKKLKVIYLSLFLSLAHNEANAFQLRSKHLKYIYGSSWLTITTLLGMTFALDKRHNPVSPLETFSGGAIVATALSTASTLIPNENNIEFKEYKNIIKKLLARTDFRLNQIHQNNPEFENQRSKYEKNKN